MSAIVDESATTAKDPFACSVVVVGVGPEKPLSLLHGNFEFLKVACCVCFGSRDEEPPCGLDRLR